MKRAKRPRWITAQPWTFKPHVECGPGWGVVMPRWELRLLRVGKASTRAAIFYREPR